MKDTGLPESGPLPRPADLSEARRVLRQEAIPAGNVQRVTLRAVEFTAICPRTGQPDFGTVTIDYAPRDQCMESKALKFYLWAYRDEGAFCEDLSARIADDVVSAIAPRGVRVTVHQAVRGGIEIVAVAERGAPPPS